MDIHNLNREYKQFQMWISKILIDNMDYIVRDTRIHVLVVDLKSETPRLLGALFPDPPQCYRMQPMNGINLANCPDW
jgi:hypothetical protein